MFRTGSDDNISSTEIDCWNKCFVVSRIVILLLMFVIVLVFSVLSKLTFVMISSNIFPPKDLSAAPGYKTFNGTLTYANGGVMDVTWIWAFNMVLSAPYFFTFCKYLWRLCFKKTGKLQLVPFVVVSIIFEPPHPTSPNIIRLDVLCVLPTGQQSRN